MEKKGQNNLNDSRDMAGINQDIILLNEMFNTIRQEVKLELEKGLYNNGSAENVQTKVDTLQTKANKKEDDGYIDVITERKWDRVNMIKEYTDFVREKIENYAEKSKEYIIQYINQNNISKFHYDDLQNVLNYFSCILQLKQKCLLCNKQLTMSLLFLNHLRKKKNRKPAQLFSSKCKALKDELACYCKCFESIKLMKCVTSAEETCKYVDIIDFFKNNAHFYEKAKNSGLLRNFHKNALLVNFCRAIFLPSTDMEPQSKEKNVLQNALYMNKNKSKKGSEKGSKKNKIMVCGKKIKYTLKDVKCLNSEVHNLKSFFKIYNVKFILNNDEHLILMECLKAIKRIKLPKSVDPHTTLIFCFLCNLHNAVLRLKVESFFCCYSEKRFRFFIKNIWRQIKDKTNIKTIRFVPDRCLYNYLKKNETP